MLTIKNATLKYVNIYKPHIILETVSTYDIAFTCSRDDTDLLLDSGIRMKKEEGLFGAKSNENNPPIVSTACGTYDNLIKAREIAAARQISFDYMLRGLKVDLNLIVVEYNNRERSGVFLTMTHVKFSQSYDFIDLAINAKAFEDECPDGS